MLTYHNCTILNAKYFLSCTYYITRIAISSSVIVYVRRIWSLLGCLFLGILSRFTHWVCYKYNIYARHASCIMKIVFLFTQLHVLTGNAIRLTIRVFKDQVKSTNPIHKKDSVSVLWHGRGRTCIASAGCSGSIWAANQVLPE